MANERDDIENLIAKVEQMRTHQRDWFARKMQADLKLSKQLESEVDELLKALRRRGYNSDRFKMKTEQKKIF